MKALRRRYRKSVKHQPTLEPVDCEDFVLYPKSESEFEIQAFIYWMLKQQGIDIRGEAERN